MTRLRSVFRDAWTPLGAVLALMLALLGCACSPAVDATAASAAVPPPAAAQSEERCLSLRVLALQAREALARGQALPPDVETLAGIGRLDGYIVDVPSQDIILVGEASARPSLHFADLCALVRVVAGGAQAPYCSLDPQPENVRRVQALLGQDLDIGTAATRQDLLRQLATAIGPQKVVIGGVKKTDRFAASLIFADYAMKKYSQGLLELKGVSSGIKRMLDQSRLGGAAAPAGPSFSRFWFSVLADPQFSRCRAPDGSGDIVMLDELAIGVLTERQFAAAGGQLRDDGGHPDADGQAFAREFSAHFQQAPDPEFAEMVNGYRVYALLLAAHLNKAAQVSGFDLDSFRNFTSTMTPPLPESLPGLVNGQALEQVRNDGRVIETTISFPLVCGGATLAMHVEPAQFRQSHDVETRLAPQRAGLLRGRAAAGLLWWKT